MRQCESKVFLPVYSAAIAVLDTVEIYWSQFCFAAKDYFTVTV